MWFPKAENETIYSAQSIMVNIVEQSSLLWKNLFAPPAPRQSAWFFKKASTLSLK